MQGLLTRLNTGAIMSCRHKYVMTHSKSTRIERKMLRERGGSFTPKEDVSNTIFVLGIHNIIEF